MFISFHCNWTNNKENKLEYGSLKRKRSFKFAPYVRLYCINFFSFLFLLYFNPIPTGHLLFEPQRLKTSRMLSPVLVAQFVCSYRCLGTFTTIWRFPVTFMFASHFELLNGSWSSDRGRDKVEQAVTLGRWPHKALRENVLAISVVQFAESSDEDITAWKSSAQDFWIGT